MIYAHISAITNIANPGTFDTELNKMLKIDDLEEMRFSENPSSKSLINMTEKGTVL